MIRTFGLLVPNFLRKGLTHWIGVG